MFVLVSEYILFCFEKGLFEEVSVSYAEINRGCIKGTDMDPCHNIFGGDKLDVEKHFR